MLGLLENENCQSENFSLAIILNKNRLRCKEVDLLDKDSGFRSIIVVYASCIERTHAVYCVHNNSPRAFIPGGGAIISKKGLADGTTIWEEGAFIMDFTAHCL